ncbi:MAG: hypothetical protein V3575_04075, partial [Candidatus Absconditabacteria bacterium]
MINKIYNTFSLEIIISLKDIQNETFIKDLLKCLKGKTIGSWFFLEKSKESAIGFLDYFKLLISIDINILYRLSINLVILNLDTLNFDS